MQAKSCPLTHPPDANPAGALYRTLCLSETDGLLPCPVGDLHHWTPFRSNRMATLCDRAHPRHLAWLHIQWHMLRRLPIRPPRLGTSCSPPSSPLSLLPCIHSSCLSEDTIQDEHSTISHASKHIDYESILRMLRSQSSRGFISLGELFSRA